MEETYKHFKIIKNYGEEKIDLKTGKVNQEITYSVEHENLKKYKKFDLPKNILISTGIISLVFSICNLILSLEDKTFYILIVVFFILSVSCFITAVLCNNAQEKYSYYNIKGCGFENINAAKKFIEYVFYKEFSR